VPGAVDGVPAQVVAWQGLLAIGRVWSVTGHKDLAARARHVALRLEHALRLQLAQMSSGGSPTARCSCRRH
jgi:hypothetical protein